jgi:hypothetical protein
MAGVPMSARLASILTCILLTALCPWATGADLGHATVLIAAPQLNHAVYGRSVLVATPIGEGRHIGFILNRPTQMKLSQLFPEHSPSRSSTRLSSAARPTASCCLR